MSNFVFILLLNVMEVSSVSGGALLDRPFLPKNVCVVPVIPMFQFNPNVRACSCCASYPLIYCVYLPS